MAVFWSYLYVAHSRWYFVEREGKIFQPEVIGMLSGPPDIVWPCLLGCKRRPVWDRKRLPCGLSSALIETDRIVSTEAGEEQVTALLCHLQELYSPVQNFVSRQNSTAAGFFVESTERMKLACWLSHKVRANQTSSLNPLSTKLYLSDLKIHFVPRSKHSLLRF